MNLKEFRDNLCELIPSGKVYHFIVPTDVKEAYIVWNETGIEYTFYDNICLKEPMLQKFPIEPEQNMMICQRK